MHDFSHTRESKSQGVCGVFEGVKRFLLIYITLNECRGYYRCTHRNVQGCLATKQVQRSDEDSTVFEITYRGNHTCTMASNVVVPTQNPPENQESNLNTNSQQQNVLKSLEQEPNQLLLNLRAGLRVQTENLDNPEYKSLAPFNFPSTSNIKIENQIFQSCILESNSFAENFTSNSYMSPATATSGVNNFTGYPNLASSIDSQISDMVPAAASAANSPTVGLEFPFGQFEFDGHNFTFDNQRFLH